MTTTKQNLPKGWRWTKLGDVCEAKTSTRDPRLNQDSEFTYIDITSIDNARKSIVEPKTLFGKDAPSRARQVVQVGDTIVSTTRPNLNAIAKITPEFDGQICSTGFCVLRPIPKKIDSTFLFFFVQSSEFVKELSDLVKGALYPAVTDKDVRAREIPLPPLDEQKRIVVRLNEQSRHIERARKAVEESLSAARKLKSAYLRDVFEGENSKSWEKKPLSAICTITMGQSPKGNTYNSKGDGYPLLNGPTEFGFEHPTPAQWTTSPVRFAEKGDILFCVRGATTGRKNFADQQYCIGRGLAGIRAQKGQATTQFIYHLLDVVTFELLKQTAGSIFPNLSGDKLENFEVFIPSVDEQESVVKHLKLLLGETENINNSLESQLAEINELPSALLRQAFAGQL